MGAFGWGPMAGVMLAVGSCLSSNPDWGGVQGEALVEYRFDEGGGEVARDQSGHEPALDLAVSSSFEWTPDGLRSNGMSSAQSELPAGRVATAVAISQEVTVELWVTPSMDDSGDPGPHRMVSNSINQDERNFTLGTVSASTRGWVARIRTSGTDNNGLPEVTALVEREPVLTHVVLTHDAEGTDTLYVQGVPLLTREVGVPFGSQLLEESRLDVWNAGYPIVVGNEIDEPRGFIGDFHHLAIYDRAWAAAEVAQRHDEGVPD